MLYISLSLSALSTLLALIALWNLGTYRMLKKQDTYQASAMYASLRRIALSLIALTASTVCTAVCILVALTGGDISAR